MSQSTTTSKSISSQRNLSERLKPSPDGIASKPPRLIALSKLKDLMHKSPGGEQQREPHVGSPVDELIQRGSQLSSSFGLDNVPTGPRFNKGNQNKSDKFALARTNDRYSLPGRLSRQPPPPRDTHIEGDLDEKTPGQCNNFSDHHQSEAKAAILNQFGIRVTQQEFKKPQNRATTKRYNTNNVTTNKSSEKEEKATEETGEAEEEAESKADYGGSHLDKRPEQQQQLLLLDQAIRGGRKLKRIYSLQSGANNELHCRATFNNDKGIGPCRIDSRVRINMTPSSDAFCQSLESIERQQQSSHLAGPLGSYNINHDELTTDYFAAPQSNRIETDSEKISRSIAGGNGSKVHRLESLEQQLGTSSRAIVSKAYGTEQATSTISIPSSSSSSSPPPPPPSFTAAAAAAAAVCSSLPMNEAGQIKCFVSNTSIVHDEDTNLRQANESSTVKQNFLRQSNADLAQQQSRLTKIVGTHSEVDANLRAKSSYSNSNTAADINSISNQVDRRHLAPYIASTANRFANESHSDSLTDQMVAASQQHCRMIGHNMNNLNGARIPNYIIDRSNIRVSVSTTIENTGSLIAACDISQQQQAALAPPPNECVTDHNYNSYNNYNLITSSKSSSPNSISLTPSPKAHAMQALGAGHHGVNPMVSSGVNQPAHTMTVPESHLDHSNHHYANGTNVASSHQHHQINQQHYSYSQPTQPPTVASNHHSHHIAATSHEHPNYSHIQHHQQNHQQQNQQQQQQQQQQQHQQQQQQHQEQQQQSHQYQHHQQQAQQQSISNQQQFIYHQIANGGAVSHPSHGYANVASNAHYHSQLHSSSSQANNLISEAHQSQLNTAAVAAQAAAAVVSQTLKTVASHHNHQQHQHYGGSIANGFGANAGLMNITAQHHPQFHSVGGLAQHHHPHHLSHNHVVASLQPSQQQQQHQHHHHQQQQQQSHQQQVRSLPVHQTNHSIMTRKYQCRMCPQVFMSKAEMKYHNQNHLREAKPYKCLQCPKAFANSSYLSQHMRIHQGLKPYACDICSRKFTQLSHLQQHKRTHTGDKPYKCNYLNCTKQFSQLSNLQSHSRCHQLDKPYKCNSCYKCFHDEQSLLEHIPRHLESKHLKRNLCIFCGSSYQQERGLVKHFQQYHTDKSPTLVTAAIAAGTTGNTSLIASLVSSAQGKFATPSSGSTTSSISSNSSSSSSSISNHGQAGGQNGGNTSSNTNTAHSNSSAAAYQVSGGFH